MCVDFIDLNRVTPKDFFPLPSIDQLVDATAGFESMNFMDAYSDYHKIQLCPRDEEKTSFITEDGTFFYTRMHFGLKNAGATYQIMMNKIL